MKQISKKALSNYYHHDYVITQNLKDMKQIGMLWYRKPENKLK